MGYFWVKGAVILELGMQDVVNSVNAFLKKLQKYIPPVTTGSVTIPVDNLDTAKCSALGLFSSSLIHSQTLK